jgi:ArsR family transcriptional regulator
MEWVRIYECLCDATRLRILNLLMQGPLCVCHIQDILGEPQVKVSKHLGYLKNRGVVKVRREGNWRIYRLADNASRILRANLACMQDCDAETRMFLRDRGRLLRLQRAIDGPGLACCPTPPAAKTSRRT